MFDWEEFANGWKSKIDKEGEPYHFKIDDDKEHANAKDWAKVYKGVSVMYEGIAEYPNERVFLSKDTLKKCMPELKGRPVIIQHQAGVTPENMKEYEVGYVTNCYYNNETGDFDCDFVIDNDEAKDLLDNKGYKLSTSYIAKSFGNSGTFINSKYDREITDLDFRHLAIVKNPRYERVKVYQNEIEEIENGGPGSGDFDHAGRPGKVGGSEPAGTGRNGKYSHGGKQQWVGAKPKQQKLDFKGKKEEKKKEEKETQRNKKYTYKDKKYTKEELVEQGFFPTKYTGSIYKDDHLTWLIKDEGKTQYRLKISEDEYKELQPIYEQKLKEKFKGINYARGLRRKSDKPMTILERKRARMKTNEKQNDKEKENNMDKIEVEQGFLNSLLGFAKAGLQSFSNAKKVEELEDEDLTDKLENEDLADKLEDEEEETEGKENEEEQDETSKEEVKENKCKNNSVDVDYFELMKEKFNSLEAGADDKIEVHTRETAFENGKKIYG